MHYRINSDHVVHETIDGETIVMNLINGHYFSFDGMGPLIWELVGKGVDTEAILRVVSAHFRLPLIEIAPSIEEFVNKLDEYELIVQGSQKELPAAISEEEVREIVKMDSISFQSPVITRYTDMQDILLLDPIHEVNIKGWPEPKLENE